MTGALNGKAIVVTGAGRGIGAGVACEAARLGARVIVNDIDADQAERVVARIVAAGGQAVAHGGDVADWGVAAALVDLCLATFTRIDGLVNMAGLFRMGALSEMRPDLFDAMFRANIAGTAYCAHHAARPMAAQGRGAIVNVVSGAHMGIPLMGDYGATKGAVASYTYAWAMELAEAGVRVNAISPMGLTRQVDTTKAYQQAHGLPRYHQDPPDPTMNAGAICYLLSDRAEGISGQIVRIEGSRLSLVAHPAIAAPVLERDGGWSIDAVADAFDADLRHRLLPVGIASLEVRPVAGGSAMWQRDAAAVQDMSTSSE